MQACVLLSVDSLLANAVVLQEKKRPKLHFQALMANLRRRQVHLRAASVLSACPRLKRSVNKLYVLL